MCVHLQLKILANAGRLKRYFQKNIFDLCKITSIRISDPIYFVIVGDFFCQNQKFQENRKLGIIEQRKYLPIDLSATLVENEIIRGGLIFLTFTHPSSGI